MYLSPVSPLNLQALKFTANQTAIGNANKLRETNDILGSEGKLTSHKLDLVEIQGTIAEVSTAKALAAAAALNGPVLVEDTALSFNALKGLPGPYIKWFLEAVGNQGLYDMLAGFEDKTAEAVCTFAYCAGPGQEVKLFQGIQEGSIVSPRGGENFGWNPVFEPKGYDLTYAEMDGELKNKISHRYLALQKLKVFLESLEE